jgi:hypothetical protein
VSRNVPNPHPGYWVSDDLETIVRKGVPQIGDELAEILAGFQLGEIGVERSSRT